MASDKQSERQAKHLREKKRGKREAMDQKEDISVNTGLETTQRNNKKIAIVCIVYILIENIFKANISTWREMQRTKIFHFSMDKGVCACPCIGCFVFRHWANQHVNTTIIWWRYLLYLCNSLNQFYKYVIDSDCTLIPSSLDENLFYQLLLPSCVSINPLNRSGKCFNRIQIVWDWNPKVYWVSERYHPKAKVLRLHQVDQRS